MIKVLRDLLGKHPRAQTAKKSPPAAGSKPSKVDDYRAVSLASSSGRCAASKHAAGKRYLLREAPRLPLADCTMPTTCSCKYQKDPDRRDGDRRLFGAMESMRWLAGPEGRKRTSRRSTKN